MTRKRILISLDPELLAAFDQHRGSTSRDKAIDAILRNALHVAPAPPKPARWQRPCQWCGITLGVAAMRAHETRCDAKPKKHKCHFCGEMFHTWRELRHEHWPECYQRILAYSRGLVMDYDNHHRPRFGRTPKRSI